MDKSQAEGRDRGGDPRRTSNIGVPNNQSMVQHERNNPNNIGNPGTVGNADNGNRRGANPAGGGKGVAAGRRRRGRLNRGGGASNTATGSGPSGGNQHIAGPRVIGGMVVDPPLMGWLMTEQGWIPYYGGPMVQMTTHGGYYHVNQAIYTRGTTMMHGGVVLPLTHDQRMMDQFSGMINQQNLYWVDQVNR